MEKPKLWMSDYTVGWICTLDIEYAAAALILDEEHEKPFNLSTSDNQYLFGSIGSHNVVISALPTGVYGNNSASVSAHQFSLDFPNIELRFLVGVAGGAPTERHDIRLADVVVSCPAGSSPGVVQYDFGKYLQNEDFLRTGVLNKPPRKLLLGLPQVKRLSADRLGLELAKIVDECLLLNQDDDRFIAFPEVGDILFQASYRHEASPNRKCIDVCDIQGGSIRSEIPGHDPDGLIKRRKTIEEVAKGTWKPDILSPDSRLILTHFGPIASGNGVLRDGVYREGLQHHTGALCFEMEAAGVMDIWPCLVVRGICDYSDSHKNKDWQPIAALTAAAFTKFLLLSMHGPGHRSSGNTPDPPGLITLPRENKPHQIARQRPSMSSMVDDTWDHDHSYRSQPMRRYGSNPQDRMENIEYTNTGNESWQYDEESRYQGENPRNIPIRAEQRWRDSRPESRQRSSPGNGWSSHSPPSRPHQRTPPSREYRSPESGFAAHLPPRSTPREVELYHSRSPEEDYYLQTPTSNRPRPRSRGESSQGPDNWYNRNADDEREYQLEPERRWQRPHRGSDSHDDLNQRDYQSQHDRDNNRRPNGNRTTSGESRNQQQQSNNTFNFNGTVRNNGGSVFYGTTFNGGTPTFNNGTRW